MKYNFTTKKIEMTTTEANEAGKFGSTKFNELQALLKVFPNAEIDEPTKRKYNDGVVVKKVDYSFMAEYINKTKDGEEKSQLLSEFNEYRNGKVLAEGITSKKKSYGFIKKWFLANCPELKTKTETEKEAA